MIRHVCAMSLVVCLLVLPSYAADIDINGSLVVKIPLSEGWTLHLEPPEALVKDAAIHVAHEPVAANATSAQVEMIARRRLAANEAIVYHATSGAHLDIDFSPLGQGESAPDSRTLEDSARFAAQSLESEMDVSAVTWQVAAVKVKGLQDSFQILAEFNKHELSMKFIGIVGYVDGFWVFFYYTDPVKDPVAFGEMQAMLELLTVTHRGQ